MRSDSQSSDRKHPRFLWAAFLIIVAVVLAQNAYILIRDATATGQATTAGQVAVCVNSPPTLNLSACTLTAYVGTPYSCTFSASDSVQVSFALASTALSGPAAGQAVFSSTGVLNFTPDGSQVGLYTVLFSVDDGSTCTNAITTSLQNFTIALNTNQPFLAQPIPNQTWSYGTVLVAFDLDNYFIDPNADVLAYLASGNANIGIGISGGEVTLTPASNWCGVETVTFTATDPTNLSATSNAVLLNVTCPPPASGSSGGSTGSSSRGSGGGGGGGGGGGLSRATTTPTCVENYFCYDWSTCQVARDVRPSTANPTNLILTGIRGEIVYTPAPGAPLNPDDYKAGYAWRSCIDTKQCPNSVSRTEVRPCSYAPNCADGIQNQDETGVDCGGATCGACSLCTDGIQNGFEEDIDCGGPFCTACNTCSNGKLDGLERGLDCGGPDCPACASCSDGIRNGFEEQVDCGGLFCPACLQEQFPAGGFPWFTVSLVVAILLAMAFVLALILKKQIASALMAFLLRHQRTNRTILLAASSKDEIIARLNALEKRLDQQTILRSQEELARIIRDYFKASLGLAFEFTNEELIASLSQNRLNLLLAQIMRKFFARINTLEFAGVPVNVLVLRSLIQETRELVYQTAVLTVDDLRERDQDLQLRDIPEGAPSLDRGYLLLSQLHLAIQFNKSELSQALYQVLESWYAKAPISEQRAIYDDLSRVYDELRLSIGARRP